MQRKPQVNTGKSLDDFIMEAKDQNLKTIPQRKQSIEPAFNLDDIVQKEERNGKAKTYYYDYDVLKAISSTAKEKGVSESKLVNDILKHVLKVN